MNRLVLRTCGPATGRRLPANGIGYEDSPVRAEARAGERPAHLDWRNDAALPACRTLGDALACRRRDAGEFAVPQEKLRTVRRAGRHKPACFGDDPVHGRSRCGDRQWQGGREGCRLLSGRGRRSRHERDRSSRCGRSPPVSRSRRHRFHLPVRARRRIGTSSSSSVRARGRFPSLDGHLSTWFRPIMLEQQAPSTPVLKLTQTKSAAAVSAPDAGRRAHRDGTPPSDEETLSSGCGRCCSAGASTSSASTPAPRSDGDACARHRAGGLQRRPDLPSIARATGSCRSIARSRDSFCTAFRWSGFLWHMGSPLGFSHPDG